MKDKRNCNNNNYPIYQPQMMVPPMGYPVGSPVMPYQQGMQNPFEQQLNSIQQQVNQLEQRISRLEGYNTNSTNNYNKYNDSNYYMV